MDKIKHMSANLYYWMSHMGVFSVAQLRSACDRLVDDAEGKNANKLLWRLLYNAASLGCVMNAEKNRWKVAVPSVVLLPGNESAVWIGGMSPQSNLSVLEVTKRQDILVSIHPRSYAPPLVKLVGNRQALIDIAAELNIDCHENMALSKAEALVGLRSPVGGARAVDLPNHNLEVFNYESRKWETVHHRCASGDGRSVMRHKSSFKTFSYYLQDTGAYYRASIDQDSESFAILWAGEGKSLSSYEQTTSTFISKIRLPRNYAVPLCLCSGEIPSLNACMEYVYKDVPPAIGSSVLRILGQGYIQQVFTWL